MPVYFQATSAYHSLFWRLREFCYVFLAMIQRKTLKYLSFYQFLYYCGFSPTKSIYREKELAKRLSSLLYQSPC